MINIKDFHSSLLKIDKKSYKTDILYLIIGKAIGHIEENNGNKYLIFDSEDEDKEVLKKIQRTLGWD